jgi:hypothetical protein
MAAGSNSGLCFKASIYLGRCPASGYCEPLAIPDTLQTIPEGVKPAYLAPPGSGAFSWALDRRHQTPDGRPSSRAISAASLFHG